jgi:CHASE1-domain containing sensor protein/signal transduction histidine kinase
MGERRESLYTRHQRAWTVPYLVFGLGLVVTLAAWRSAFLMTEESDTLRFSNSVERARHAIQGRIEDHLDLLRTTAAMIETQGPIDREHFHRFYKALSQKQSFAGVRGLGFSYRVPAGQREEVIARMRSQGWPNFEIFPTGGEEHAVLYIEPIDARNKRALGLNMHALSEERRQAMDRARDTGDAAVSQIVQLVQEIGEEVQPGFLIYYPVYSGGDPGTIAGRRQRLVGFVYSPFRSKDLFDPVLKAEKGLDIAVAIYDSGVADAKHLLYSNVPPRVTGRSHFLINPLPGHVWGIRYVALPSFRAASGQRLVIWIPIAGVLISLVLAGLSLMQATAHREMEAQAVELHRREYQQRLLAQAGTILGTSLDVQSTLSALASLAVPSFADWCSVDLLEDSGQIRRVAVAHIDPAKLKWARELQEKYPPEPDAPTGVPNVLRTGQPELYSRIPRELLEAAAKTDELREIIKQLALESAIIVPLTARGRTVGAISFIWAESGFHYDDEDLRLAEQIAARAGLAVDNANLYQAAQEELRVSSTLQRLGMALSAELDLGRLVQQLTDEATALTRADIGAFFYTEGELGEGRPALYALSGGSREEFERLGMPGDTAIFGPTLRGRETVRLGDVRTDPRYGLSAPHHGLPDGHPPVVSYLAVPVISRSGETIGALLFGHREPNRFGEREEQLAKGLAAHAAIALDNARLFAEKQREEDRVRELNENLEHLVKERTTELEASNHELEAFCYSVSHDLRAPLRSVDGFSKAVIDDYGEALDEQGVAYLQRVRAAARRMDELITALLNLSRLTRAEIHRQPIDLSEVAEEAARDALHGEAKPVDVRIAPGMTLDGDPRMVRIVLDNLLSNAVKFSLPMDHPAVEVGMRDGAVFVRDNGVGFNPEYANKLFGPFERLHSANEFPGSGIGLATVQRIVARHGGEVWAESQEGHGATFWFRLDSGR